MREKSCQQVAVSYETAIVPPPTVEWGARVTVFKIPSSLNGKLTEISIHSNLINAASEVIRNYNRDTKEHSTNSIDLPDMTPGITTEVFDVLIKWLYRGQVLISPPSMFQADQFWALVFRMSEILQISALQTIAFEKFEACLSPRTTLSTEKVQACKPSEQLLDVIFQPDDCEGILHAWIVDHIYWMYECVPSALEDVETMTKLYPIIASKFCTRLFRLQEQRNKYLPTAKPKHPSEDDTWAKSHDLDLKRFQTKANVPSNPHQIPTNLICSGLQSDVKFSAPQESSETHGGQEEERAEQTVPREGSADTDRTDPDLLAPRLQKSSLPNDKGGRRKSGRANTRTPVKSYDPKEYFKRIKII